MEHTTITKGLSSGNWFRHWFDSSFYHKLYANRDEREAAVFIDELISELKPAPQSTMLDLGCGNGRHSKYLASKGFWVRGIDLAASSIRHARKFETPMLSFYCHDMRLPFGKNAYDHVFNFFTSFGYFDDPSEDQQVVNNISAALKPGGILVMDYINSAFAEKKMIPAEEKEIDGIIYHIQRSGDEEHFFKKITIENGAPGELIEHTEQVRKFSVDDFRQLFKKSGLELQQVYGDYRLNEYNSETSPRLILLAKKINYEKQYH